MVKAAKDKPKPITAADLQPEPRTCGNCVFIDMKNSADIFCRRYPPTLVVKREKHIEMVRQFYPNVHPVLDWCGEHKTPS